ncbi:hypothetical protein OG216_35165 [Streptomycetaceae bacterium NBC_01309]
MRTSIKNKNNVRILTIDGTDPSTGTRTYGLRSHDVWTLTEAELLQVTQAGVEKHDLGTHVLSVLMQTPEGIQMLVPPEAQPKQREHLIRAMLAEALFGDSHEPAPEAGREDFDVLKRFPDNKFAPMHGWRSDEEVIQALKELIVEALNGVAEDMPPDARPADAVGAAVTFGVDASGTSRPFVWVRSDLPSPLRADLWGFCMALAARTETDIEPDEDGIWYVGVQRSPVTGPGVALLGAVVAQRFGRRPDDCAFPVTGNIAELVKSDDNTTRATTPQPDTDPRHAEHVAA